MRKFLVVALILVVGMAAYAQESKGTVYLGIGAEGNGYDRDNFSSMLNVTLGKEPRDHIAFGWKNGISVSLDGIIALETMAFFRWYLFPDHWGFFVQPEAGIGGLFEESETMAIPVVTMSLGGRFFINETHYLEPYIRGGFPLMWGGGLGFGITR